MRRLTVLTAIIVTTLALGVRAGGTGDKVDAGAASVDTFAPVAAIFESSCVRCHGPDLRKGELLLTSHEALRAGSANGPVVVPGDPDASRLVKMISGAEPKMPKTGRKLAPDEVEAVRRWIAAGAPWPDGRVLTERLVRGDDLWSLQPVADVRPPVVESTWPRNPIDAFVLATLRERGLEPSPEADRRTLIRRLTFDLHGLPPDPKRVEAFVADERSDAYERLVDELLASPRYGEHWARHWLDIAHYADTHGFERDRVREHAWHYRDYVIRSLNADKPYDRFLREQIAGDVIAPGDPDAVVATGFLAAGPWDFVGQVEAKDPALNKQARADDLDDMVTQVMTASVALTVNCARCHDHKLDPITQEDYYGLWAVFAGVKRGDRAYDPAPAERARLVERKRQIVTQLAAIDGKGLRLADVVGGGAGLGDAPPYTALDPVAGRFVTGMESRLPDIAANRYVKVDHRYVDGVVIPDGGPDGDKAAIPVTSTGVTVTGIEDTNAESWDYIQNGKIRAQVRTELGGVDYHGEGRSMLGLHTNKAITFDLAAVREDMKTDALRFTAVVGLGSTPNHGSAVFRVYLDGEPAFEKRDIKGDGVGHRIDLALGADRRFLTLMATDADRNISHDLLFLGDPLIHAAGAETGRRAELASELAQAEAAIDALGPEPKVYAVVPESTVPQVHVLRRGAVDSPGNAVTPGAVACVTTLEPDLGDDTTREGERRRALAQWITDPANPLTARVWVNRLWHHHFGQGIVTTPSDFGYGGSTPSHPALLDWLAGQLVERGWSTKQMHRLIVTSAAYRQSSRQRDDAAAIDAGNALLWRMNPRRLGAEALRDSVLSVSGSLNTQMYGPGFRDFRYVEAYAPEYHYVVQDRPELWRRSIYRFVVRSTPQPLLTTLDCPDPSTLTPKRLTTTTALQALSLMNNAFMLDQAERFAERVMREAGEDRATQVVRAFKLALQRRPSDAERAAAERLIAEAGLIDLCRGLLNANEFVFID